MQLFSKPIHFGCNQCGECCRQVQVPVSHADVLRLLARFDEPDVFKMLQLHPIEASDPDAVWLEGRPVLLTLRTRLPEGGCGMLVDDRCSIYAERPMVCRTFPFVNKNGRLRISGEFELLVGLACDKTPFYGSKEVLADIETCQRNFVRYRRLIKLWNSENASQPERQTLKNLIHFIRQMEVAA